MEERIIDWIDVVPALSEAEQEEVSLHLSLPSVQKYFRSLALKEVVEQAKEPVAIVLSNPQAHLASLAYSKGRLSVSHEIIEWAISKQKARQLSLK